MEGKPSTTAPHVLLIGPKTPPYGGMAIQGELMQQLMTADGIRASFLASNLPFPNRLRLLDRLRGIRPFLRSMYFSYRLFRMLGSIDVVHILACSWLYFFVIVCPAVVISRLRGKRVVLNYRGGEADAFLKRASFSLRPIFRMAHVVTAPSQFLVNVIGRRIGVPVQIVPNIVNFRRFSYRERSSLRPRMIVTRHLLKLYDIESVIRAFQMVQCRYPQASLQIVGTGDQERHLKSLVTEWNLQHVNFLGYVPQENLPPIYDRCDILLNASLADNFPGSLVEAAASGVLVVSTGAGGIPSIFKHEESALLVTPGDWRALGSSALRVLEDQTLATRLSRAALRQCKQYDWSNIGPMLYNLYGFAAKSQTAEHPMSRVAVPS